MIFDLHMDVPWIMAKFGPFNLKDGRPESKVTTKKLQEGGVSRGVFALYVSDLMQDEIGPDKTRELIDNQIKWIRSDKSAKTNLGYTPCNFRAYFGLEGGRLINGSIIRLNDIIDATDHLIYVTLTHNRDNDICGSAASGTNKGLTTFGKKLVKSLRQRGIYTDVSHASDQTIEDIVSLLGNNKYVMASHSGCRDITPHQRNLSTNHILNQYVSFIGVPLARKFVGPTLKNFVHHIGFLTDNYLEKSIGIGSDIDGADLVDEINDVSDLKKIPDALSKAGFSDYQVQAICGTNAFKFFSYY